MGWRIFSILNAIVVLSTVSGPFAPSHRSLLGLIGVVMSFVASGGVFLYAYERPASRRIWNVVSWLFAASSLGVIAYFVVRSIQVGPNHSAFAVATLLALVVAYHYFTWLALHRLGSGLSYASSSSPNKNGRFGSLVTEAASSHPQRTKVAAWCIMLALLAVAPLVVWHTLSRGDAYNLVVPILMGIFFGLKAYASVKKARSSK